jgi:pyruvate formate lyase activating enzyme
LISSAVPSTRAGKVGRNQRESITESTRGIGVAVEKRVVLAISRMTMHNGPGLRTVILFKGCPLRCLWCSTPESQKAAVEIAVYPDKCIQCGRCVPACAMKAIRLTEGTIAINRLMCNSCGKCAEVCHAEAIMPLGQEMTVEELVSHAKKDLVFYKHSGGGVTLSGGEPLLQPGFTGELLKALKDEGINVGVDTCGHVPWTTIEPMLSYIDFFLWDLKHMNPQKHRKLTGVSNELILRNVRAISERSIPLYIRVPLIPGYNDSEENIRLTCEAALELSSVVEVDLLPLHHLGEARYLSLDRYYPISDLSLIPDHVLNSMKEFVESYGLKCRVGG